MGKVALEESGGQVQGDGEVKVKLTTVLQQVSSLPTDIELEGDPFWQLQECIAKMSMYQPKMSNLLDVDSKDLTKISRMRRNQSAYNLKCLMAFYGYSAEVFCLAVSILDRFVTKVKVQPKYLSCISTTCFYMAARAVEGQQHSLSLDKLIRVSQCDCRDGDIQRMEAIIKDKLQPPAARGTITPLVLLNVIHNVFTELSHVDVHHHLDVMISKLVMCMCHAELLGDASAALVALAVFSAELQELHLHKSQVDAFTHLQALCEISDREFLPFRERLVVFLRTNYASPSPIPKLQLKWAISNRTMARLRPGYYGDTDLPIIHETPFDSSDVSASCEENLHEIGLPASPFPEDFCHHFSYPSSPSNPSPLSTGLPPCHLITYADVVSGRFYLRD